MIVLHIRKPVKYSPKKWIDKDWKELPVGLTFTHFAGNHPDNPEHGTVTLDVEAIDGTFENISELIFIEDEPATCKLLSFRKKFFGGYRIEVEFNMVFRNGLAYMLSQYIDEALGIIGFSETDKISIKTIEGQKELLQKLTRVIIPGRSKEIINLAIPSIRLYPNNQHNSDKSHFVGDPKTPKDTEVPKSINQTELFHLATLKTSEFSNKWSFIQWKEYLSFYLNIKQSEKGWPEKFGDFKVFSYNDIQQKTTDQFENIESEVNFDAMEVLEIPDWNHCAMRILKLSEEEQQKYSAVVSVYKTFFVREEDKEELTKLFGYPDSVQNCVSYEAERIKNKREYSDAITKDGVKWQLLFQIDPYSHWFKFFNEFGDGRIYYMIKQEDLIKGNFEDLQVVVQNT